MELITQIKPHINKKEGITYKIIHVSQGAHEGCTE